MDQPWTQTRTELLVSSPWLTVEKNDYRVGDRPLTDYFIVRRQPFVLVVARAPQGIILIRQYRPATGRWYWSLPAGYLEPGEPVVAAAARELFEETALRGSGFSHVGTLDPLPAYVASAAHVVTCDVAEAAALQPANDEADEVAVRSWSEIAALIAFNIQQLCTLYFPFLQLRNIMVDADNGDRIALFPPEMAFNMYVAISFRRDLNNG